MRDIAPQLRREEYVSPSPLDAGGFFQPGLRSLRCGTTGAVATLRAVGSAWLIKWLRELGAAHL